MNIPDLLKTADQYIPQGVYCYNKYGICPFWEKKQNMYPHHEDGFCYFLNKSDWDINEELNKSLKIVYDKDNILTGLTVNSLEEQTNIDPISGKKIHQVTSLMWNKVKSCDINDKYN